MDLETLHRDYLDCASNKKKSADTVMFELHRERNLAWLLEDVNDRTLAALLYAFVAPRPRPREVIASLMPGKVVQFHFDRLVRPVVEKRLTDSTFNNRVGYGRFVDDMWWVVDNLEAGLAHVALSEKKLYEEYGYRMHPTKRYQQHVALGGEFISTWFKGNRIYIGNRVVRHCEERIREWNRLASPWMLDHFLASINSYFGMMKHRNAFRIIYNLADKVAPEWRKYCEFNPDRRCFVAREGYKHNELLCRRFHFKLHKLTTNHGTRTNQRPGVPAAGAPGKDGIDGCPRSKVRKAGKEVQHPVS